MQAMLEATVVATKDMKENPRGHFEELICLTWKLTTVSTEEPK